MSNRFHLVVFDWEGTLADTLGQILHILTTEARNLGLGEINNEQARSYANLGLHKAVQKLFPHSTLVQQENLIEFVQKAMLLRHVEVQLIPGARECIDQLLQKGILLGVASNKGHLSLQRAIASAGLDSVFSIIRSASESMPKPHPQMLEEIIEFSGVQPNQVVMIGDSAIDMEMAVSAGVKAVGFDYYHQQTDTLKAAGAATVFDNYAEVFHYLDL